MIDLVISGPDMSGTGTQVQDTINLFQSLNKKVRDMRGTEIDALFHAKMFAEFNANHLNLNQWLLDPSTTDTLKLNFLLKAHQQLSGGGTNADLKVASFLNNGVSTYIEPDSADVWIFEEPTKRGAGQVNRAIEQQRTRYKSKLDPQAAAYAHQAYRIDEFLRFRKVLRERDKIILRSRSEESAPYQIYDEDSLPNAISKEAYLNLPGHKVAFGNPPTHIFIVCALDGWTRDSYLKLKANRSGNGRLIDDHEANPDYQILVNERYRTGWFEKLYDDGCRLYGSTPPKIFRFDIYDTKEEIRQKMTETIMSILQ